MFKYLPSILLILTGIIFLVFGKAMLKKKYGSQPIDENKLNRMALVYRLNGVLDIAIGIVLYITGVTIG